MKSRRQRTDSKARVQLPRGFENSAVLVEQVSDSEVRIRKAASESDSRFAEEVATSLSDRDRDALWSLLVDPPDPNDALRKAASRDSARSRSRLSE